MRTIETTALPQQVKIIEHTWIPMRDGTRLSARLWLPEETEVHPVPAILEYIPYRKRDWKRVRDSQMHTYFAAHGYACIRVDLRGSGDSEGVLQDEYLPQELEDGEDILQWLEEQPWCTGDVGMIGISWGGFNGLQIAARQPRQLKAVISLCSTDDRYADDIHYMGGCLLNDNLSWASVMFAFNSLPPDPEIAGEKWRELWLERLRDSGLWVEKWIQHQHRDDYWKHGSICENYDAIQCPVFAVSGWADGYSNAVFRMMQNLKVPRKALIGPWSHRYPHEATPGPAIGFLQECLRWWNHWLKGVENDIMKEPMIRVWMQDSVGPETDYEHRPGRWVAEYQWPSQYIHTKEYKLAPGVLYESDKPPPDNQREMTVQSPLSVGLFAGKWYSTGAVPDSPYDQREEDGGSLVFESEPLKETMEIMGAPIVELEVSSDRPVAMIAVRLSDVAPDDKATRVTYGILNLCHRHNHERPEPLQPGKKEHIRIMLNDVAQNFPAGHRIRISASTSYWPLAWVPPLPVRLTVNPSNSKLTLPVRPPRHEEDEQLPAFDEAETAEEISLKTKHPEYRNWIVNRDLLDDTSTLHVINDSGEFRIREIDLEMKSRTEEWYRFKRNWFNSVNGEVHSVRGLKRKKWKVETHTRTKISCDTEYFYINATLDAFENGDRIFCRTWNKKVKRMLV